MSLYLKLRDSDKLLKKQTKQNPAAQFGKRRTKVAQRKFPMQDPLAIP
jgi:hypothetical protein